MDAAALRHRLAALAGNLAWSWCPPAEALLASLDPALWEAAGHAPLAVLRDLPEARLAALAGEPGFLRRLQAAELALARLVAGRGRSRRPWPTSLRVGYLCMEYGLHESLPLYSGGLGVLAGDHCKAASDLELPLAAVGILWREGYYRQEVLPDGRTGVRHEPLDPAAHPLEDSGRVVEVPLGRRRLRLRVWRLRVGRVPLLLLDADHPANRPEDRRLTARLYHGGEEERLAQEVVLGIGGLRALEAIGFRPTVVHLNEGHAAFAALEGLRRERAAGRGPAAALARVRRRTVFTTHTPVAAGHDRFDPALVWRRLGPLAREAGLDRAGLLALGREAPGAGLGGGSGDRFCMTALALRTAGWCNGVSAIHGRVSREMWWRTLEVAGPEEAPIGHVTNGVHRATWTHPLAAVAARRPEAVPDRELWEIRCRLRARLVHEARRRLLAQARRQGLGPEAEADACRVLREDALTLGFARRFATYKRATLLFSDVERLARILDHPAGPAQVLVAGKAHPADAPGQAFLRRVQRLARRPELRERVVVLEDYDMALARLLVAGCDVWLNTPRPPHEASGTSGMKAALNGGLNLSVADGWWPEAYDGRNGWLLPEPSPPPKSDAGRDRADAAALYGLLEEEVLPLFHTRDRRGLPRRWLARVRRSLATVPPAFAARRMLREYVQRAYLPAVTPAVRRGRRSARRR